MMLNISHLFTTNLTWYCASVGRNNDSLVYIDDIMSFHRTSGCNYPYEFIMFEKFKEWSFWWNLTGDSRYLSPSSLKKVLVDISKRNLAIKINVSLQSFGLYNHLFHINWVTDCISVVISILECIYRNIFTHRCCLVFFPQNLSNIFVTTAINIQKFVR